MKTRRHITEKEIRMAAGNIKLQYGLATMLINEVRSVQRGADDQLQAILNTGQCPKCGSCMLVDRIHEEGRVLCDFLFCDYEMKNKINH